MARSFARSSGIHTIPFWFILCGICFSHFSFILLPNWFSFLYFILYLAWFHPLVVLYLCVCTICKSMLYTVYATSIYRNSSSINSSRSSTNCTTIWNTSMFWAKYFLPRFQPRVCRSVFVICKRCICLYLCGSACLFCVCVCLFFFFFMLVFVFLSAFMSLMIRVLLFAQFHIRHTIKAIFESFL